MRKFAVLVTKEIRELLTPYVLVPIVLTVALFAVMGKVIGKQSSANKNQAEQIAVLDEDKSQLSRALISNLQESGFKPDMLTTGTTDQLINSARNNNDSAVLIIPNNLEKQLSEGKKVELTGYTIMTNFSVGGLKNETGLQSAFAVISQEISDLLLSGKVSAKQLAFAKNPLILNSNVVIGNRSAAADVTSVMSFVQTQTYFIPILLFLVIVFASQMIATAVASEKENKTLETLLSTPVSRGTIVAAKLVGAGLVALFFALFYLIGFHSYLNGLTSLGGGGSVSLSGSVIQQLGLTFGPSGYLLIGLSLFMGILCALAISLIIGAFAEDVKSVQSLIAPLMILIMIPYFLVMFLDFTTTSAWVKDLVYAIPFSHPFLAAQDIFLGQTGPVVYGIIYQAVVFVIFALIAIKIFSSDYIMTMRLNWSKKNRR